jgi:PAS domain S-box-containing protein
MRTRSSITHPSLSPQQLLQLVAEHSTSAFFILDQKGLCIYMNPAAEQMTGFSFVEIQGKHPHDVVHYLHPDGKTFPIDECVIDHILPDEQKVRGYQSSFIHKEGHFYDVSISAEPIKVEGKIVGSFVEVRDITEEVRRKDILQKNLARERLWRNLIESTSRNFDINIDAQYFVEQLVEYFKVDRCLILLYEPRNSHNISVFKQAFSSNNIQPVIEASMPEIFNQAFESETAFILESPEEIPEFYQDFARENQINASVVQSIQYRSISYGRLVLHQCDRSRVWTSEELSLLNELITHLGSALYQSDLTKQEKLTVEALRESEGRFRNMAEATQLLISISNEKNEKIYFNRAWLEYIGLDMDSLIQEDLKNYIHPDDYGHYLRQVEEVMFEKTSRRGEYRLKRYDGLYRYFLVTITPRCSSGNFLGYIFSGTDIHDLKITQDRLCEYTNRLEESNKDLENFASVVSHDLKAPLRRVITYSDMLYKMLENLLPTEGRLYLDRLIAQAADMSALIDDLLALYSVSRKSNKFRLVALDNVLDAVIANLSDFIEDMSGSVKVGSLCTVEGDEILLQQLFQNLIQNALKFHRPGLPPIVKISSKNVGGRCVIKIQDNGIGFDMAYANQIFNIFQRLQSKELYPGTGIGLAIVKKIIERHQGQVSVDSMPDRGTTFTVSLPVRQTVSQPEPTTVL